MMITGFCSGRWPNRNAREKEGALAISPNYSMLTLLSSKFLVLLIVEVDVWRDVEVAPWWQLDCHRSTCLGVVV